MNHSILHRSRALLGLVGILLLIGAGMASAAENPGRQDAGLVTADARTVSAGSLVVRGSRTTDPPSGSPAFTLNRVRLYVIAARSGEDRVVLPPLPGDHPDAVMTEVVESTNRAVERIRRRYPWSDLQVVGLSQYLLQARPVRAGAFIYSLLPEPGAIAYSSDAFRGELSADTQDGQLAVDLEVFQRDDRLFQVSMLLEPGRTLVLGRELEGGEALFAVLTLESPEAPAGRNAAARAAPAQDTGNDGRTSDTPEAGPAPVSADLQRIYTRWDTAPRLLDYTRPDYPPIARKAGVDGTVTLHVVIGVDGKVEEVKVATSSPKFIFDEAAAAAVRNWRYEPALIDGHPVRAKVSQTVQFTLGGR